MQAHFRAFRHEIVEHRREHRTGESRHQSDAQFAGDLAGHRAGFLGGVLKRAHRFHAALVVAEPGRRRRHAASRALEQLDLQGAFHRRNVLRNAGLCCVFPLRRTGKGAFLAHGDNGADLPQRDIGHDTPKKQDIRKSDGRRQNILFSLQVQPA